MAALPAQTRYTEAEYLELEGAAAYKNEYIDGYIVAMAGASPAHVQITVNVVSELYQQLRASPCLVYNSDMRVKAVGEETMYAYPDATIVCGEPDFEGLSVATLLNPIVIIEVLSRSTEAFDRGLKFASYRQIPSLREYVLIAQDSTRIERYERQSASWTLTEITRIGDAMRLSSVNCTLAVNDVYNRVALSRG